MNVASRPRPRSASSGLTAYLLIRLTGVLLAVLVLGHFTVTHITTDVAHTGPGFVAHRWHSALWLAWDWLMLAAALAHAGCGLWVVVDDYVPGFPARRWTHAALVAVICLLMVVGGIGLTQAVLR